MRLQVGINPNSLGITRNTSSHRGRVGTVNGGSDGASGDTNVRTVMQWRGEEKHASKWLPSLAQHCLHVSGDMVFVYVYFTFFDRLT